MSAAMLETERRRIAASVRVSCAVRGVTLDELVALLEQPRTTVVHKLDGRESLTVGDVCEIAYHLGVEPSELI